MSDHPLILDLDGTLIQSDTTLDLCFEHLRRRPLIGFFQLLIWFLTSKSQAKVRLADLYGDDFRPGDLPYTALQDLEVYRVASHRALASGSEDRLVQKIATHLKIPRAWGTTAGQNLVGGQKAEKLRAEFPDGFAYVGDSLADIPVWQAAERAYAVQPSAQVVAAAQAQGIDLQILIPRPPRLRPLLRSLRLHQWAKNGLLLTLPFLNLTQFQFAWMGQLGLALLAFGLVASGTYVLNDLLDIQADRRHATKALRPIASGALPIPLAVRALGLCLLAGFTLAALVGLSFFAMLLIYAAVSLLYSFFLKRLAILDTLILSLLFCWRIMAGGILIGSFPNAWFILALGFFFLSMALAKRAIELSRVAGQGAVNLPGRGYTANDAPIVTFLGLGGAFTSVILIAIYCLLDQSTVIHREVSGVLVVMILMFWLMRIWLYVGRGLVDDDPIIFALKDRVSQVILVGLSGLVLFEQWVPHG